MRKGVDLEQGGEDDDALVELILNELFNLQKEMLIHLVFQKTE